MPGSLRTGEAGEGHVVSCANKVTGGEFKVSPRWGQSASGVHACVWARARARAVMVVVLVLVLVLL